MGGSSVIWSREGARTAGETTVMDIIRVASENGLVVLVAVKAFGEWRKDI
jgi:hypothetical protein